MLSLNFASKILDTNIKSCLTQKRVKQILLHDTNSILQVCTKRRSFTYYNSLNIVFTDSPAVSL